MTKKGMGLVLVLGVLATLTMLAASFVSLTNGESRLAARQTKSIRAFYLAEAGLEVAIQRLKQNNAANFTLLNYSATISGAHPSYTVTAVGAFPYFTAPQKTERKVSADITVASNGNPANVTNAIELSGAVSVGGSAQINGTVAPSQPLNFQSIFGISEAEMEARANNKYTDPANNTTPVDKITWVNLVNNSSFKITQSGWSGSGILIVKEAPGSTADALEITGGTFNGIIWVIGNLRVSGNPQINGAIFVNNDVSETAQITGNPTVCYDISQIQAALNFAGSSIQGISNWREVP